MARQDVNKTLKRCWQALILMLAGTCAAAETGPPRIAIIIDDLGYQKAAGERAINLPGPISYAILPNTPRDAYLAKFAHAHGKEVLLHLPLQAEQDRSAVGGSLLLDMSRQQFLQAFASSIDAVPHVVGVNSHRGSLLTRHPGHMGWLMEEILDRGNLFFVDSYTTAESVALRVANESGVPALRRDVFLDPDPEPETLVREFARLKKLARQQGFAVGIGHPYTGTLDFLEEALPLLTEEGYDLVSIGDLVALRAEPLSTTSAD
ncbi:MAG: divergent polysaccharide deacetylase family protein [Woeseiaceae bacterium]